MQHLRWSRKSLKNAFIGVQSFKDMQMNEATPPNMAKFIEKRFESIRSYTITSCKVQDVYNYCFLEEGLEHFKTKLTDSYNCHVKINYSFGLIYRSVRDQTYT